jgi:hypothetical protein
MSFESTGTATGVKSLTGRQITLIRLGKLVARSKVADIHRACDFLEWAIDVRKGCKAQRSQARSAQMKRRLD